MSLGGWLMETLVSAGQSPDRILATTVVRHLKFTKLLGITEEKRTRHLSMGLANRNIGPSRTVARRVSER